MSILLSMIMLISLCSGSVLAAEEDKELLPTENSGEWIITEMSALDETVDESGDSTDGKGNRADNPGFAGDVGGDGLSAGRRAAVDSG